MVNYSNVPSYSSTLNNSDDYSIKFCHNRADINITHICSEPLTEILITTLNAVNVVINIIHILLIRKLMSHIKEGVFYRVLIFTSAIDILSALAFILQINCAARKATVTSKIATIIISLLT